ncbi:unnamed protein product, partial [Rotaria sordida]
SQEDQQILIGIIIIIIIIIILYATSLISIRRLLGLEQSDNGNKNQLAVAETTNERQLSEVILKKLRGPHELLNPIKRNLVRSIWVGLLSTCFLSVLFITITLRYYKLFEIDKINDKTLGSLLNHTTHLIEECESTLDYRIENLKFFPFALSLIFIFSWSIKRDKQCLKTCNGRPGLLSPIEPFRIENRFTTATVFGIIAYGALKIFEELLFGLHKTFNHGVLFELIIRIAIIAVVGFRYYPILASLKLRNVFIRFFACLYILCDIIYTIVRESSCMGFLPLAGKYTVVEEAKLRMELGTWFIIYGLIKNIPHFFFLSYIGAELCVRFVYDSIYVSVKKKKSIWSTPHVQFDELEFAKYYVTKLLRRNCPLYRTNTKQKSKQQNVTNRSLIKKFFDSFYYWDEDFHFTTIATCTYTVAFVFLYYLACTFIFLYLSRPAGVIPFLRSFIENSANVELDDSFTLKHEIILSAVLAAILYGFQLLIGMQNYKKHKQQLYKGIYIDVPSTRNMEWSSIVSKSVHYSGFLVGYMAWGFVICFHLILLILIGIRILSLRIRQIELVLTIIVPILIIYLIKILGMKLAGNFFADCFLGMASCIIRLIKATFLNVVFMARLDYSFLGRPLEKFDAGFAAYVSYLHVEKHYSNPLMLVFSDLLLNLTTEQSRENHNEKFSTNINDSDDENRSKKQRKNKYDKSSRNINHNTTDNQSCHSITEINLTTKLQNLSTMSGRNNQTIDSRERKLRKFAISDDEINVDNDDNSSTRLTSSTLQQQAQLSKSSINRTKILNHEYLLPKQDQYDDDNYDYEITNNNTQAAIVRRPHSIKESIPLISIHSNRQLSERIQTKQSTTTENEEKKRRIKRKIARFRWFLAYTIIHNFHIFDLKKCLKNSLTFIYSQQNQPVDEQLSRLITTDQNQEPTIASLSEPLKMQRLKGNTCKPQSPTIDRLLSVPSIDEYPSLSPAELYITSLKQQLLIVYSQNATSPKNTDELQQENIDSPLFRSVPISNESTNDYPPGTPSNINSSRFLQLLSHNQHMQAWYEDEIKKFQKKRPHCYFYVLPFNYYEQKDFQRNALLDQRIFASQMKNDNTKQKVISIANVTSEHNN